VGKAQVEPQLVQARVRSGQGIPPLPAASALRLEELLRQIEGGAQQACGHRVPERARKRLAVGHQPLQQVEYTREDDHLFSHYPSLPGDIRTGERLFIPDSYANRPGKGTHRAVDRLQQLARRYRYVLRLDVVKHFPSIDHAIMMDTLARQLHDERVLDLAARIIASGDGVLEQDYEMVWFPGDDLLAACRPRGLPIGNLTSQFWSNVYLHPFDQFATRELGCRAYLRYADSWGLRAHVLSRFVWGPEAYRALHSEIACGKNRARPRSARHRGQRISVQ